MKKETKTTEKTTAAAPEKAAAQKLEEKVAKSAEAVLAEVEKVEKKTVETVKKAVKSAPAKKTSVKETIFLQYYGKEINKDDILAQVKDIWTKQMKKKASEMKSVTLYLKPEESAAYYVINGDVTGRIDL